MILRCCWRSSTASRPAHRASADFPVPARPPSDRMPISGSSSRSMARRCSADRPFSPKTSRSPRTSFISPLPVTRPRAEPRSEWMTRPVLTGMSCTSRVCMTSFSYSSLIWLEPRVISSMPVQPESTASSCRYSSARSPIDAALTRSGRSLETTVTLSPSLARFIATARMRESLSPSCSPDGSTDMLEWFSSTRRLPPSPTGIGKSSRSCLTRSSSRSRRAWRAKYPISGSLRLDSSSAITTTGSTTACSAKRKIALGSDRRTEVSSTYVHSAWSAPAMLRCEPFWSI